MPTLLDTSPRISVKLFKAIQRASVDGGSAVSARYAGQADSIDLTEFLAPGSSVRTSKNVREPAGGFSITFADRPQVTETVYALVEPQDMIEIRMWSGRGPMPNPLPIIMRGFISQVRRVQAMGEDGKPQRAVYITGQDYGKAWQILQILYLRAYAEGQNLLSSHAIFEIFGGNAKNTYTAAGFVEYIMGSIVNPWIGKIAPKGMPASLTPDVSVAHGTVSNSFANQQGSLYDMMKYHGDVGVWNELYTEDRNDGAYYVYRPVPALDLNGRKIQPDAPDPVYVEVEDSMIKSLDVSRTDGNVANFFWVNNQRFDMIDDMQRRLHAIAKDASQVSTKDYPNTKHDYYGLRSMMAETQQGGDAVVNQSSGNEEAPHKARAVAQDEWINYRRKAMMDMNIDNVVLEAGMAVIKGGPERGGGESMKAGDYVRFKLGHLVAEAYCPQIDHEFNMFQSYTTTLTLERGNGFAERAKSGGAPWMQEQARRGGF